MRNSSGTQTVSLGKGAWDCDTGRIIPPEMEVSHEFLREPKHLYVTAILGDDRGIISKTSEQAQEFEEIATMDYPFEGIPTIPPRKDMDRMVR